MNTDKTKPFIRVYLRSSAAIMLFATGCTRYANFTLPEAPGGDASLVFRFVARSEEHTSELQSLRHLVCRPISTLFPYTTLFRSLLCCSPQAAPGTPTSRCPRHLGEMRHWYSDLWRDRKSTRLNSSHLGISYADRYLPSFPTRRSSDLYYAVRHRLHQVRQLHAARGTWGRCVIGIPICGGAGTGDRARRVSGRLESVGGGAGESLFGVRRAVAYGAGHQRRWRALAEAGDCAARGGRQLHRG